MSYRKKHKSTAKLERVPKESLLPSEYANPGTERMIMTSKLVSGMPYQRPVEDAEVDRLIAEWDDRLLDPLIVSFRAGNFYLVDGQHRVCAVRKMNGGRDVVMQCLVYSGLTYEDEAELCYKLDKAKKRLSLSQSTNALLESGRDEEIVEIKQLLERKGFVWALNKSGSKAYEIKAARGVIAIWTTVPLRRVFPTLIPLRSSGVARRTSAPITGRSAAHGCCSKSTTARVVGKSSRIAFRGSQIQREGQTSID